MGISGSSAVPGTPASEAGAAELTADEADLLEDDWDDAEETAAGGMYQVADPIEPLNRAVFQFNDKLYVWVLRPVALGYRKVTPQIVRTGVQNFFSNLSAPIRFVNCLLQGKGQAAGAEMAKFMLNSTWGVLGFRDLFDEYPEMNPDPEDLGQSFGRYGIGDGFYIVLPFFGSSTARDTVGMVGDAFLDPITYVDPMEAAMAVEGFKTVNRLTFRIQDIDDARKAAFDPYAAARNFYIQSRRNRIKK